MEKPTPEVSEFDIDRIIERDYSQTEKKRVLNILKEYLPDTDNYRVWAGVLKISNGDTDRLKKNIKRANFDYRDILVEAEYPEYFEKVGINVEQFEKSELRKIVNNDWKQYNNWFNRSR